MARGRRKIEPADFEREVHNQLLDLRNRIHQAVENKGKVNEKLRSVQGILDKNNITIGYKPAGSLRSKLLAHYKEAKEVLENEETLLRELLMQIFDLHEKVYEAKRASSLKRGELMQLLLQRAHFTPLWVSKPDEFPPPLVGAIPTPDTESLQVGWDVAAYVNGIWMLAEIVGIASSSGAYEVRDLDDEQKDKKYTVRRSRMIPLPHWRADPQRDSHALFPLNAIVLALYPQTTCFYKGVIERVPETATDGYMVAFEDAQFPQGYSPPLSIPQRYVVVHRTPRPYKRKKKGEY